MLGPSGCGKTTLLRSIADLQEPTDGTIRISGQTPKELRQQQKFGFVFQQPVLFDWRTVKKNVELPLEIMYQSKADRAKRADEMLEMVGLKDFANHFPKQLSGGMQQRVNIARAFGIRPEILLMDEPFSALDEFTKKSYTKICSGSGDRQTRPSFLSPITFRKRYSFPTGSVCYPRIRDGYPRSWMWICQDHGRWI